MGPSSGPISSFHVSDGFIVSKMREIWVLLDNKKKNFLLLLVIPLKIRYRNTLYGPMVNWGHFQNQYIHPIQATASLAQK